ncbi:MAG: glycoside hydrolase family 26 protein [Prevotella sp.]|nr:glycoside hydrolase family 26 protein [Prevotella sp.]
MNKKTLPLILFAVLLLAACGKKKADDPLADSGRTQRTENLLQNLKQLADSAYLFGHQDSPMYGIGWVGDDDRSDVKTVCNDFPAVMGFDLGHLELGDSVNLDKVPFDKMREQIIKQFDRGGVVTLSWHLDNPLTGGSAWVKPDSLTDQEKQTVASVLEGGAQHEKFLSWLDRVADFFNSLETPYGVKVPVIFRPWHEHTGSWFWWGQNLCTKEQYVALWKLTESRLREKGVNNVLYAYSPGSESDGDSAKYLERYPGDDCIDFLGTDIYCSSQWDGSQTTFNPDEPARYIERTRRQLSMICQVAKEHQKVAILSETGFQGIPQDKWWTQTLAEAIKGLPIAYVLVWRNAHDQPGHYFAPYPGQISAEDFVRFYNLPQTLFVRDINGLYLKK